MITSDRFVTALDQVQAEELICDVAIFGSGIAGLTVACSLPSSLRTIVFSKGTHNDGSTPYAQGGIAAAIGSDDDPTLHATDTLVAAGGIADPVAVATLTDEAPDAITFLEKLGTRFDRTDHHLALTLEGGHSRARIAHAGGDATGAEISRALFSHMASHEISIVNDAFLVDLLLSQDGRASGAIVLIEGVPIVVRFSAAVLASGGAGQLFAATTSPAPCTGDGMAVAFRAGAEISDMEFVQFHPTVLVSPGDPRPLISEALRGEGAVLRDRNGQLVMAGRHPLEDLAPRDVVARIMVQLMVEQNVDHLFLDATQIASSMPSRFPTISASLSRIGIDPMIDLIPVSPASHYTIGGVRTSIDGETSIDGLYGVGEMASVGIHGANRLASNSLLEGVVFGRRIAHHITSRAQPSHSEESLELPLGYANEPRLLRDRSHLRREMDRHAGVVRTRHGLEGLLRLCDSQRSQPVPLFQTEIESANMALVSSLIVRSALSRTESRGAHFREDAPTSREDWAIRQVIQRDDEGEIHIRPMQSGDRVS